MSHALSAHELEDIRSSYQEELAGLTFNSKPIINILTTIAQENLNAASVICKTIEDRIRMAPPHQKLPVMYLLDSISKNVGSPFTPIFGRNLYKTYMDCYTAVDGNTRRSLEALFNTWKLPVAGSTSSVPVYPPDDTRKIDEALLRMRAVQDRNSYQLQYAQQPLRYQSPSPFPTQGYQQYTAPNSYAEEGLYRQTTPMSFAQQIDPVSTLERNPLADMLISEITSLLRTLGTRAELIPGDQETIKYTTGLRGLLTMLSTRNLRPLELEDIRRFLPEVAAFCARPIQPLHRPEFPLVGLPPQPDLGFFAQLAQLAKGVGSSSQPNFGAIPLSSAAMLKPCPEVIDLLYLSMPIQCNECGQRWRNTPEDIVSRDQHLDRHFKTNQRLRELSVRSLSRALYLSESDWIHFSTTVEGEVDIGPTTAEKTVDPSTSTVPKPSDPALHDSVCPICKETFSTDWDDTHETWIWKNALSVADVVYHGTCYAETVAVQARSKKFAVMAENQDAHYGSESAKHGNGSVNGIHGESEDEDIMLPNTTMDQAVKKEEETGEEEKVAPAVVSAHSMSAAVPTQPFVLADALQSLSATLSSINGVKRKASEELEDVRVKREPDL